MEFLKDKENYESNNKEVTRDRQVILNKTNN